MKTLKFQTRREQVFLSPELPKRLAINTAKRANAQRIAEILERYTDDYFVEGLLEVLIKRLKPEDRLAIVNES